MIGYAPEELTISIVNNSYVMNFKIFVAVSLNGLVSASKGKKNANSHKLMLGIIINNYCL